MTEPYFRAVRTGWSTGKTYDVDGRLTRPSYVLSAFYTTPKHWEKILGEWLGMVHRYGVTAFHATDCANGAKEFAGWSQLRKKENVPQFDKYLNSSFRPSRLFSVRRSQGL